MYTPHTCCRACSYAYPGASGIKSSQSEALIPVFDLGIQPLANDFAGPGDERAGYAPLKVLFCPRCTLGQLSVVVRPEILYANYSYVTSTSSTMARHFESLADFVGSLDHPRRLLEIGSNDGRMLEFFAAKGMKVCGIDPAENLAEVARGRGIPTVAGIFNESTATSADELRGPFDVIMARHVFCHTDRWLDFIKCLSIVSRKDTVICIEAPYVCDMLARGEFDTIYHEHTSYLTIRAVLALLKDSPFELCQLKHFSIHGGALMLVLRPRKSGHPSETIEQEAKAELAGLAEWAAFSRRAHDNLSAVKAFVAEQRGLKKTVAGFGASAKSTVWVSACGFSRKDLAFITDNTAAKQWKLSPGTDIPIMDEGALLRELPDYALCFAWNFREEILAKNELARLKGVKFVFPIPSLEVV